MISPLALAILREHDIDLLDDAPMTRLTIGSAFVRLTPSQRDRFIVAVNRIAGMARAAAEDPAREGDATKIMRYLDRLFTPTEAAQWLVMPHAFLNGATPIFVFGKAPERVIELLEHLLRGLDPQDR